MFAFAYGVLTGALSVLGAIALAMTLYWLFSRWRAQRLKRKYNHTVSPKAQLSLSRWSKDKMARTITGFSRRRKLALAPVPAYEAPDFGPVTMPSLAAEEEQPPPTPPSSHWPKQGKAPRGIEDSKFDLRAALTTNGPVRCFDVDAVRRKPSGGGSGGDSAPGGGGSSPPAAGGRKLCAKSKPFWELQQEKEAKGKQEAPPPQPPQPVAHARPAGTTGAGLAFAAIASGGQCGDARRPDTPPRSEQPVKDRPPRQHRHRSGKNETFQNPDPELQC